MKNDVPLILYIAQLEEKIQELEANKKILLQIIETYDDVLKTGISKKDLPLLSEPFPQLEKNNHSNCN